MKGLALLLGHLTDGRQIIVDENTKIGIFVVAGWGSSGPWRMLRSRACAQYEANLCSLVERFRLPRSQGPGIFKSLVSCHMIAGFRFFCKNWLRGQKDKNTVTCCFHKSHCLKFKWLNILFTRPCNIWLLAHLKNIYQDISCTTTVTLVYGYFQRKLKL